MVTKTYNFLTEDAKKIREKVFMEEQGFKNEFDEIDDKALHIVVYDKMMPIATCRVVESEEANTYIMGRLAVIKEYRGKHIGKGMLLKAEVMAANHNGR
ncbi:MAG: GNAT family N-acetyltransferase, partial [Erysipelotrichaceae bacterium]|nr:GNAT family N-acetyltransferase [Erysipelotrichaceae bacterium]